MEPFESKIDDVVLRALELQSEERAEFVARECADDARLEHEVKELLSVRDSALQRADGSVFELIPALEDSSLEVLGPYELEAKIGEGGTSVIYRGRRTDGSDSRPVAIKLLKRGMDTDEIMRRFRREGNILSSLRHPNIARVFGGGVSSDHRPYLVMELIEGVTIRAYCERHGLGINQRLRLVRTGCEAISYAHRNLIVHRDLKPDNMLVTRNGTLKVLDFGISKLLDPDSGAGTMTDPGQRMLTPEYAAPEQLAMGQISTAVDIYSLGVVLYELLAGRLPFERSEASWSFVRRVLEEEPEPLRTHNPQISADLGAIVLKSLSKNATDRYRSTEDLSRDLANFLDHRPVRAIRGNWRYRLSKLIRRRSRALVAASLALLALGGLVIARETLQQRVLVERNKAVAAQEFLLDLFHDSDPFLGKASPQTLEGFLQIWLEAMLELDGLPEFRARLLRGLARLSGNLALHQLSSRAAEGSLVAFRSLPEIDNLEVAKAEILYGDTLVIQDRFEQAESPLRRALSRLRALEPPEPLRVAEARTSFARLLIYLERPQEALALLQEVQAFTAGIELPTELEQALHIETHFHSGNLYLRQNNLERALHHLDATWHGAVEAWGETHGRSLYAQRVRAKALARAGHEDEAIEHLEFVVAETRQRPDLKDSLGKTLYDLAEVWAQLGRTSRARDILAEAKEVFANHPEPKLEDIGRCDELLATLDTSADGA